MNFHSPLQALVIDPGLSENQRSTIRTALTKYSARVGGAKWVGGVRGSIKSDLVFIPGKANWIQQPVYGTSYVIGAVRSMGGL